MGIWHQHDLHLQPRILLVSKHIHPMHIRNHHPSCRLTSNRIDELRIITKQAHTCTWIYDRYMSLLRKSNVESHLSPFSRERNRLRQTIYLTARKRAFYRLRISEEIITTILTLAIAMLHDMYIPYAYMALWCRQCILSCPSFFTTIQNEDTERSLDIKWRRIPRLHICYHYWHLHQMSETACWGLYRYHQRPRHYLVSHPPMSINQY